MEPVENKFKCYNCDSIFEGLGVTKQFIDPVYGKCEKIVSACPYCNYDAVEYKPSNSKSKNNNSSSCGGACSCCG